MAQAHRLDGLARHVRQARLGVKEEPGDGNLRGKRQKLNGWRDFVSSVTRLATIFSIGSN